MKLNLVSEMTERSIVVNTMVWTVNTHNNNTERFIPCDMLLDTGAYMTVIDRKLADRNEYKRLKPDGIYDGDTIGGIGGRVPCEYAVIPNIMIDGVELGSLYVCVVDFRETFETSAILGFNFIREFKMTIDISRTKSSVNVTLEPKFDVTDIHKGERFNKLESRFGLAYVQGERI